MERVAVALSGGADSAVAAARLLEAGYEVVGVFGRFVPPAAAGDAQHSEAAARAICVRLDIPLHVVDLTREFRQRVINYFVHAYAAGETPNPCVACNMAMKFGLLLDAAVEIGCQALATGHYARRGRRGERWGIRRAADLNKDQSYVLMGLRQGQVRRAMFPVGDTPKPQVRAEARRRGLPALFSPSQEICFVAGDYGDFVARFVPPRPGPILDLSGRQVGEHRGLIFYTVGQRRGLRVAAGQRVYVVAKDPARNALIVGPREALRRREFYVRGVNWVSIAPLSRGEAFRCLVMLRYRGRPIPGEVEIVGAKRVRVAVGPHDQAIAPGQAAVFYDDDGWLLGGGFIEPYAV